MRHPETGRDLLKVLGNGRLIMLILIISGFRMIQSQIFLLDKYCPYPRNFTSTETYAAATQHAHYIWYVFVAIGLISAVALRLYGYVTHQIDKKKLV